MEDDRDTPAENDEDENDEDENPEDPEDEKPSQDDAVEIPDIEPEPGVTAPLDHLARDEEDQEPAVRESGNQAPVAGASRGGLSEIGRGGKNHGSSEGGPSSTGFAYRAAPPQAVECRRGRSLTTTTS
ncbi:MAG TPA: hypothetical protein VEM93_07090 [Actinomycetota bacterium]|nr:hypothetical protein [Actinomycetota bacterium]